MTYAKNCIDYYKWFRPIVIYKLFNCQGAFCDMIEVVK